VRAGTMQLVPGSEEDEANHKLLGCLDVCICILLVASGGEIGSATDPDGDCGGIVGKHVEV
jgi:hypothetical protein